MRKLSAVIAGVCLFGGAGRAVAGLKLPSPVNVGTQIFDGALGDVRASSDSVSYIGCRADGGNTNTTYRGNCYARNASGVVKVCTFQNNTLGNAVAAITPNSYLIVSYDAAGNCLIIGVDTGSMYRPATL